MAYGYSGASILNSVSDALVMILGFLAASRMRWWGTVGIAIAFEPFTLWTIRDNLTLNVLRLVSPAEAVKEWQAEGWSSNLCHCGHSAEIREGYRTNSDA